MGTKLMLYVSFLSFHFVVLIPNHLPTFHAC